MRLLKHVPQFNFMKWRFVAVGGSLIFIAVGLGLMFTKGLRYGIDFSGGVEILVKFADAKIDPAKVRQALVDNGLHAPEVVEMEGKDGHSDYLVSLLGETKNANEVSDQVKQALMKGFGSDKVEIRRVDAVGPKVGSDLRKSAWYSIFYSIVAILVYVWFRFDVRYAPGAVLCLVHDVIITLGLFVILGKEFNLTILAAILTIVGYSLNDTIVVFDRIRETAHKIGPGGDMITVINRSVNEMLARTILTSLTTLLSSFALFWKGGGVIHDFAFAMMVGIVVGTYSSIFIAAPLIIVVEKWQNRAEAGKARPRHA